MTRRTTTAVRIRAMLAVSAPVLAAGCGGGGASTEPGPTAVAGEVQTVPGTPGTAPTAGMPPDAAASAPAPAPLVDAPTPAPGVSARAVIAALVADFRVRATSREPDTRFSTIESSYTGLQLRLESVPDRPESMQVCWRLDLPGLRRDACTLNRRADGLLAGVRAVYPAAGAGGATVVHATSEDAASPRRILYCRESASGSDEAARWHFSLFEHEAPFVFRDRSIAMRTDPPTQADASLSVTELGGERRRIRVSRPTSGTTVTLAGNAVEAWLWRSVLLASACDASWI
jgi:hypothetical protein